MTQRQRTYINPTATARAVDVTRSINRFGQDAGTLRLWEDVPMTDINVETKPTIIAKHQVRVDEWSHF